MQSRPAGWYPDGKNGETRYWDGASWTGITRPPRRKFAARAAHPIWGTISLLYAAAALGTLGKELFGGGIPGGQSLLILLTLAVLTGALGIYLLRGRGISDRKVRQQQHLRPAAPPPTASADATAEKPLGDLVESARIQALANPETSRALQNLQNLLYTRTITEAEYQKAKDTLLGS